MMAKSKEELRCDHCNEVIKETIYYWEHLSPIYCHPTCATWGCPNAILHRRLNDGKE